MTARAREMTEEAMTATRSSDGETPIGHVRLANGETLHDARIGWSVWGTPARDGRNVVLMLPGTSSTRSFAGRFIGADRALDPARWCVISMDPLGGGASSRPSHGLWRAFPEYGIADMTDLQRETLERAFGLTWVAAICGPSMGSFQGLDWAARHGEAFGKLVLLVPSASAPAGFREVVGRLEEVLETGCLADGRPGPEAGAAILASARIMLPLFYGETFLAGCDAPRRERLEQALAARWLKDWDPLSLARRYRASAGFAGHPQAAADRRPVLILPSPADRLLPTAGAEPLRARFPGAEWELMPTDLGHFASAGAPDAPDAGLDTWLFRRIARFLAPA